MNAGGHGLAETVRRGATRIAVGGVTAALAVAAAGARADELRGPAFGTNKATSAIDHVSATPDTDDYVAVLAAGDSVTATVFADANSALRPQLQLLDPDGTDVLAKTTVLKGGAGMRLNPFKVPRTGRWAVRVSGTSTTEGAYSVKFRVSSPRSVSASGAVGGTVPLTATQAIEAVQGSSLTLTLTSAGKTPAGVLSFTAPDGSPVHGLPEATKVAGSRTSIRKLALGAGTGAYLLTVGRADGAASYKLRWSVRPPARPSGTIAISAEEPRLTSRPSPVDGQTSKLVRFDGSNFSRAGAPTVLIGGAPASVLAVGTAGTTIDVVVPAGADDAVVPVTVVNPDGQAFTRQNYFHFVPASVPPLASISPSPLVVYATETADVFVNLSLPAPPSGLAVVLSGSAGIGMFDPSLSVAPSATSVKTAFLAPATSRTGTLTATSGNSVVANVTILPARKVDMSNWRLNQTSPVVAFVLPQGTVIPAGGYLIVARNVGRTAFEQYWQRTLAPDVLYIDAQNAIPRIDGAETFTLTDQYGTVIDGPTRTAAVGNDYNRRAGLPAGTASSWTVTAASAFTATPGTGQAVPTNPAYVYISEFSDVPAGGNKDYQFVEIHFDRAQ